MARALRERLPSCLYARAVVRNLHGTEVEGQISRKFKCRRVEAKMFCFLNVIIIVPRAINKINGYTGVGDLLTKIDF